MNKYVKVDDVMALINTSNRGNCDYFIVDKIEELCNSNNVYDIEKDCYNKAIDDYAKALKPVIDEKVKGWTNSDDLRRWCENSINKVAEQLKSKTDF